MQAGGWGCAYQGPAGGRSEEGSRKKAKKKAEEDTAAAAKQAFDLQASLASAMEAATKVAVEAAAKAFERALEIAKETRDSAGHVKYSATVDQTSDVTVPPMSRDRAAELYQVYFKLLGGPPDEDEECSIDQLTALEHLILSGYPPYVDFALWIANYDRKKKEFTFAGMVTTPSGALRRGEFLGPPTIHDWVACWRVFRTACIMLRLVDVQVLDRYEHLIAKYHRRHGEKAWAPLVSSRATHEEGAVLQAVPAGGGGPRGGAQGWQDDPVRCEPALELHLHQSC